MRSIVIIGNGVSGITAARHIRKRSDFHITVISNESRYFFSRPALMYLHMGHMKWEHIKPYEDWFWEKNRINLVEGSVTFVDVKNKQVVLSDNKTISFDVLIIATGSRPNKFGWNGQDLKGVQGFYHLQDVYTMERYSKDTKRAVIVGGGLIGIEMAEMLSSRGIPVTFLVREKRFWDTVLPIEEAELVGREIRSHHIDLRLETELKEILGDDSGRVKSVVTNEGETILCQFVGLTVGVSPNIAFLKDSGIEIDRGVLVDEYLQTNVKDIYAIGDCAQHRNPINGRRAIEQVWYTGKIQGETVAKTICEVPTRYQPGHWFNSAKFFDIEYQTYGVVGNQLKPDESTFYWESSDGKKSFRVNYSSVDKQVRGCNVFGIRMRHEVWNRWLDEKQKIDYVMSHLSEANFDPEFFQRYEPEIISKYNSENVEHKIKLVN